MIDSQIQTALINALDHMPVPSQRAVLDLALRLSGAAEPTPGTPFEKLKHLVGMLPADVAEDMEKAVQDFERIDVNEW